MKNTLNNNSKKIIRISKEDFEYYISNAQKQDSFILISHFLDRYDKNNERNIFVSKIIEIMENEEILERKDILNAFFTNSEYITSQELYELLGIKEDSASDFKWKPMTESGYYEWLMEGYASIFKKDSKKSKIPPEYSTLDYFLESIYLEESNSYTSNEDRLYKFLEYSEALHYEHTFEDKLKYVSEESSCLYSEETLNAYKKKNFKRFKELNKILLDKGVFIPYSYVDKEYTETVPSIDLKVFYELKEWIPKTFNHYMNTPIHFIEIQFIKKYFDLLSEIVSILDCILEDFSRMELVVLDFSSEGKILLNDLFLNDKRATDNFSLFEIEKNSIKKNRKGSGSMFDKFFGEDSFGNVDGVGISFSNQKLALLVEDKYFTFDNENKQVEDVTEMVIEMDFPVMKMPVLANTIKSGDIIIHQGSFLFVEKVSKTGRITALEPTLQQVLTVNPIKVAALGGQSFIIKVQMFDMFGMTQSGQETEASSNPMMNMFGGSGGGQQNNMMNIMAMSSLMSKKDSSSSSFGSFEKMMEMSMMSNMMSNFKQ